MPHDPENVTGFFEWDGTDEEMNRQYYGFRAQNEAMVNWACQLTDDDLTNYRYRLSDPKKDVKIGSWSDANKYGGPIVNYFENKFYGETYEEVL